MKKITSNELKKLSNADKCKVMKEIINKKIVLEEGK